MPITTIDYTNWRGERGLRQIQIEQIVYRESEWHAGPQWIVEAYDQERGALREFAARDIHSCHAQDHLDSHGTDQPLDEVIEAARKNQRELPGFSIAMQQQALIELADCGLGQFYLRNRGLNGYWIDYIVTHPDQREERQNLSTAERFLLEEAPLSLATQERHRHFHAAIRAHVRPGMTLASVPCGLMGELLLSGLPEVKLIGIDLDPEALLLAAKRAEEAGLAQQTTLYLRDAWELGMNEEVDLLTSNGLSIYIDDDERVLALFREFYQALKPGGLLITSTLTPPPTLDPQSEWRMEAIDLVALAKQKLLISDLVQANFAALRSSTRVAELLQAAGFDLAEVIADRAGLFPSLIARKPG
ncbi:MAG: methyltransferase domain-containing protein [Parachlamydiales bacterium]